MSLLAADARAFVAAVRKELRQVRRYPTLLLSVLFWPVLLPTAWVLMGLGVVKSKPAVERLNRSVVAKSRSYRKPRLSVRSFETRQSSCTNNAK